MCVQSQISSKRVISFPTARNLDSKSAPQLPFQYKTMSTWISTQHILLQQNTACPTWNQSLSPWEDNQSSHVGTPWNQWMVHLSRFRSLLMRGMLNSINPQHKNRRNIWTHFCSYPYSQDNSEDYIHQSITNIICLLSGPNLTDISLSFGYDTQNTVKYIATLLNHVIPAPNPTNTTITPIFPQPTSPSELTPRSTFLAPHPAPAPRVV